MCVNVLHDLTLPGQVFHKLIPLTETHAHKKVTPLTGAGKAAGGSEKDDHFVESKAFLSIPCLLLNSPPTGR